MSVSTPQYPPGHDPRTVESSADIKYNLGDIDGAKMVYQQALLDWVDDARESSSANTEGMKRAVADLWIDFAALNRKSNRFKGATEAFEGAVSCEIAGRDGKVWLEYAKYQEERTRHKTAQKIYLRALIGDEKTGERPGAEEASHPMLWQEFLRMTRDLNKNPNLSLKDLRDAVEKEHVSQIKKDDAADGGDGPPLKRAKMEDDFGASALANAASAAVMHVPGQAQQAMALDTPLMSAESIEKETAEVVDKMKELSPDISAAWFARDGDSPPSRPEPPLFTPSPPKFSDATGREVLGDELALTLIQMLLKKDESDQSGNILLDVCRACWMMTALKEKEAAKAIETLDNKMVSDYALEVSID